MRVSRMWMGAGLAIAASSGWAATVVAGTPSCSAASKHPFYPTIQSAVDSVPAGSTVLVCPGTYREQVGIDKDLTLKGVEDANTGSDLAVIAIPDGEMATIPNVAGGQPIAAQLAVTHGASVNISGITIDGAGNTISTCAENLVGVLFQNASGALKNSVAVNQILGPDYVGCQSGLAVYVQTDGQHAANVTVSGNRIANFDKNGITANGGGVGVSISNNSVTGLGPTPAIAQNGIQVSRGATGSVTGNTVSDAIYSGGSYGSAGILVYAAPGIDVSGNTVSNTQYAITVVGDGNGDADGASITSNKIQETRDFDAIDLCGSSNDTVQLNTIRGTDEAAIHVEGATFCGTPSTGNLVAKNTIDGACAGVLVGPGASQSNGKNTFYNVATQTLASSDVCPAGGGNTTRSATAIARHRKASPAV